MQGNEFGNPIKMQLSETCAPHLLEMTEEYLLVGEWSAWWSYENEKEKKKPELQEDCGGARSEPKLSREVHKCLLCKTLLPWGKKPNQPNKNTPKITLTSICNSHYPDFLKASETHQNSGSHAKNWAGMYWARGKTCTLCLDVLPYTSASCNLGSHSSSLLPLFLYIKFHSNLITLISAFLNS